MHAGASCSLCVSSFDHCRGHFVYEPFTVVVAEALATILLGVHGLRLGGLRTRSVTALARLLVFWRWAAEPWCGSNARTTTGGA